MKRHRLEPYLDKRLAFIGEVSRFSQSNAYNDKTIMLKNVRIADTNEYMADHVWFRKVLWADRLKVGQTIQFNADVMSYKKRGKFKDGRPRIRDIKLENAGSVTVI